MGVDDDLLFKALGARRADVIHAQRVNHRGTDIAGHAAQRGERHDDSRQSNVVEHIHKLIPLGRINRARRLRAGNREDAPENAEEEHENQRDDVDRDAVTEHRDDLHRVIHLFALVNGAENTQRNGDRQRNDGGENIDKDRVLHRDGNDLNHVLLVELGITEVALKQSVEIRVVPDIRPQTHPAHIAHDQRIIKTHLRAQLLIQLLIFRRLEALLLRFQLGAGRVGRNQVVQRVHQKRNDEKHKRHISDTLGNIFAHLIHPLYWYYLRRFSSSRFPPCI